MGENRDGWDMDELLEFLASHSSSGGGVTTQPGPLYWTPPADIYELDDRLHVVIDIPGMKASQFDIRVREGALLVSGERRMRRDESRKRYHALERNTGLFVKRIPLPAGFVTSKPESRYSEGLLEITFPRKKKGRSG